GFLFLKKQSIVYVLDNASEVAVRHARKPVHTSQAKGNALYKETISAHGVEVEFQNASQAVVYTPGKEIKTRFNYFLGKDETGWSGGVRGYEEIRYQNLYNGIDMRIYMHQFTLKYEFIV